MRSDSHLLPRRSTRCLVVIAVGASLLWDGSAFASTCATTYRKALDPVRDTRVEGINGLIRTTRTPDPQISGRWLFSAALFDKAKKPKTERFCAETATQRNGKQICKRYETRTIASPDEPAISANPTAEELKDLKSLAQFVEAKGAVPELGANGRYGFLFQRVAQDLRLYLQQEPHPALCAGAPDLVDFYEGQMGPLKRRLAETGDLARRTRAAANGRVANILKAETAAYDKALAAAKALAADAAKPATEAPSAAPTVPAAPPLPSAPEAAPVDLASQSLAALTATALRPLTSAEQRATIVAATSPFQALAVARTAFIKAQSDTALRLDPTVREAAGQALRTIETAAYADLLKTRYAEVDGTLFGTSGDIRRTHKATCTCAE